MSFSIIIKRYVEIIQQKMNTPDMLLLKESDTFKYNQEMYNYVPKFADNYPTLFKQIINNENLDMLNIYLNNIDDIENNKKSLNDVRYHLGNLLNDKYVNNK
jgi:hypothetical protein